MEIEENSSLNQAAVLPLQLRDQADQLFLSAQYPIPFEFNQKVADVFDDMARRSIPDYEKVTRLSCLWAQAFYQPATKVFDLGCSTATLLDLMARCLPDQAHLVGIDQSKAMVEQARKKLLPYRERKNIEVIAEDLLKVDYQGSSVCVLNYTLQFLPVSQRPPLLKRIFEALLPEGILILSEKTRSHIPAFHEVKVRCYEAFKQAQGYSQTEIERKKEALDRVLVPFTLQELRELLDHAGFYAHDIIHASQQFVTLVAIKKESRSTT